MTEVKIDKSKLESTYKKSVGKEKELLESLFSKEDLQPKNIMDRVKTFEDALEIVGCEENEKILLNYNGQNKKIIAAQAFAKLCIICEALNEGWTPNYGDSNEYKYYPYWNMSSSGSGFSFNGSIYFYTYSSGSARLSCKSEELSDYVAKQFFDLYKDMLTF